VTVQVQVPTNLNAAQKEALQAFDDALNNRPAKGGKKKKGIFG
jgi:DnaJ-class molecular chaperone